MSGFSIEKKKNSLSVIQELRTDCTYYSCDSTELYTEGYFSFLKDTEYPWNREKHLNMFAVHLSVTLYNCSYGRSDCSLCLAAPPEYRCVWCEEDGKPSKCVYEKLCRAAPTDTCPPPEITGVRLLFSLPNSIIFFMRKQPSELILKGRFFSLSKPLK